MNQFLEFAYFQHQFVPMAEAKISIATHGLHYGTAALGGLRGFPNPQNANEILLFRLDRHCQRLSHSAKYLNFELPPEKIQQILTDFVQQNWPRSSFYIRPLIYTAGLGIAPRLHDIEKDLLVYGLPMNQDLYPEGIRCRISTWIRQEDCSVPLKAKTSASYITSALAKTEAIASGFDEAILLNSHGKVSETAVSNLFIVRNGVLITPSVEQNILEGITRESILQMAMELGIETQERPVDKSELLIADEVFCCGTAIQITSVTQIENYHLPSEKPVATQLKSKLQNIIENKDESFKHWVFSIPRSR